MLHTFPNIRIGLMVGIGGGAPSRKHDIRLGDVVVSSPCDGNSGVFEYDFGKTIQNQNFQYTKTLDQPPELLRSAVTNLRAQYERFGHQFDQAITSILEKKQRLRKKYKRPEPGSDMLYQSRFTHPNGGGSCAEVCGDNPSDLISRSERTEDEDNPAIHYGLITSANQLMKNALIRDTLAAEKDVLCFEMEAAGLMNHFPCLVIRGICDYSDSHKNKESQGYAAMAAAAYAKDLLYRIPPNRVEAEKRIGEILSGFQETIVRLLDQQYGQEHDAILKWLTPIDYAPLQTDYIGRRQSETGQWFLDSKEYQAWLKKGGQSLLCPGIPGSGKTIITAIVIDDLYARFQRNASVGIAYLYCDFRRQHEQKTEDLLANLLKQLAQKQVSIPDDLRALYDQYKDKPKRPTIDEISRVLVSASSQALMVHSEYHWSDYSQRVPGQMRYIHLAAWFGLTEMVDMLIEDGQDSDCKGSDRRTPLSYAAENGHETVVKLLLARADVEINSRDGKYGKTPLLYAAANGQEAVVKLLLARADVEINSREYYGGRTSLLYAAAKGHERVVKLLLARADVEMNSRDNNGQTPLSYAAANGHEAIMRLLQSKTTL